MAEFASCALKKKCNIARRLESEIRDRCTTARASLQIHFLFLFLKLATGSGEKQMSIRVSLTPLDVACALTHSYQLFPIGYETT